MKKNIRYSILNECKCGPEPFFVLISSIDYKNKTELDSFLKILISLIENKMLDCFLKKEKLNLNLKELNKYINQRLDNGENLAEPPNICNEYDFTTTDVGLMQLKKEDRPIPLDEWNKNIK